MRREGGRQRDRERDRNTETERHRDIETSLSPSLVIVGRPRGSVGRTSHGVQPEKNFLKRWEYAGIFFLISVIYRVEIAVFVCVPSLSQWSLSALFFSPPHRNRNTTSSLLAIASPEKSAGPAESGGHWAESEEVRSWDLAYPLWLRREWIADLSWCPCEGSLWCRSGLGISRHRAKTANESPRGAAESENWRKHLWAKLPTAVPSQVLQIWRKGGGRPGELPLTTGNLEAQAASQLCCREGLGKVAFPPPLKVRLFSCKMK